MDKLKRKEMIEQYKNRMPEKGVISIRCIETGDSFLGISKDTRADFNSIKVKLATSWHPNKQLQALWDQYGEEGFEWTVLKVLEYKDPHEDHTDKLEELRDECLALDSQARKIWK